MTSTTKKRNAPSLAQLVLDAILLEVDSGTLQPGERLVSSSIAKQLGISRAPVREALNVLAGRGIVDLRQDREAILRQISAQDLIDIWEIHHAIFDVGIRAAAQKFALQPQPEALIAEFETVQRLAFGDSIFELFKALDQFHKSLNEIGGNPQVNQLIDISTMGYVHRIMAKYVDIDKVGHHYAENYRRLYEALKAGDITGSRGIWRYHADWSIEQVRSAL